jgi:hypothetical protein
MKTTLDQFDWSLHPVVQPATDYDAICYVRMAGLLDDVKKQEQRMADTLQQKRLVLWLSGDTVLDWWLLIGDPDSAQSVR